MISDARDHMLDLALKNRAFLERASNPSKRELKLFELGQCREARASVVVDGLIHKTGLKSHNSGIKTPILLDSGALGSSYVSKAWINENREAVRETYEISDTVTLGDGDTKQTINEEVDLLVDLKGPDGVTHSKAVRFKVMDTSFTHIIGLPDIEELFLDLFISLLRMGAARRAKCRKVESEKGMRHDSITLVDLGNILYYVQGFETVRKYHEFAVDNLSYVTDLEASTPKPHDMVDAWTSLLAPAPELDDLYEPSNFSEPLLHMSLTREEQLQKFMEEQKDRVSDSMIQNTDILKLLNSKGQKVFIPDGEWRGLQGLEELYPGGLELQWRDEIKDLRSSCKARPINPKLYEAVKKEFERLRKYFYIPSDSKVVSPLVIAPKATPPYVRFCGDYVKVNTYIDCPHGVRKNVRDEIAKIKGYSRFGEFDMANSFHQIRLGEITSNRLSVVTQFETVRPKFLPEGVSPASIELQKVVDFIFGDLDWVVAIFDNLLVCANSDKELYDRTEVFFDRCIKHNLILKMSKTNIGFEEVEFFGYRVTKDYYELTEERKQAVNSIPFPQNKKEVQKFMGFAIYFQPFVPGYASLAAPLYDMSTDKFDWNRKSWKVDYIAAFKTFKQALNDSQKLAFPDFDKRWVLRTDASLLGIGGVLLQEEIVDGNPHLRPIFFVSKKFSESAQKWSTIQQEAYGIYYTVYKLQGYLLGKFIEVETDHNNLKWMESSINPAIVRMRVFLQSYITHVRHIPGKDNGAADYLSRTFDNDSKETADLAAIFAAEDIADPAATESDRQDFDLLADALLHTDYASAAAYNITQDQLHVLLVAQQASWHVDDKSPLFANNPDYDQVIAILDDSTSTHLAAITRSQKQQQQPTHPTPTSSAEEGVGNDQSSEHNANGVPTDSQELLKQVHNGRAGHFGAYRTWVILRDMFPGHGIPFRTVQDFVQHCPICQKNNKPMRNNKLFPQYRTIKSLAFRKAVGIDHVTMQPASKNGYKGITVIVNLFSGHTELYPYKHSTGEHDALCLHDYFSRYGRFDEVHTDPGTDFKSKILEQFNRWYGITHIFSLIDRHESNGCERVIQEVIKHLSALLQEERIVDKWDEEEVISSIRLLINSAPLSERGNFSAYDITYGEQDQPYFVYGHVKERKHWTGVVGKIQESMKALRDASKKYQDELIDQRARGDNEKINLYQPGDFVLAQSREKMNSLKLMPRLLGPYEVIRQYKNDVVVTHMASQEQMTYHVEELTLFVGTREQAAMAALLDNDVYYINEILAHKGKPAHRTSMEFLIQWADGKISWDRFNTSKDSFGKTIQFQTYCDKYPELRGFLKTREQAEKDERLVHQDQIFDYQAGDYFYQDLETYGWDWYRDLNLPEAPQRRYYSKFKVGSKDENGYLVEDLDIPTDREHKAVKWLASDFLRFANKEIPDGGQRISRDLVRKLDIRSPSI